jgi:hypothetical protein
MHVTPTPTPPAVTPQSSFGPQPTYHYDVQLDAARHELHGHGTIDVVNSLSTPLDELVLRSWGSAKTYALDGGQESVTAITVDGALSSARQDGTVVRIPLARPLQPGAHVQVGLDVDAVAPTTPDRFGSDQLGNMMFGNVLPTLAVHDDEGWNVDPYMPWGESFYTVSADWDVNVRAPQAETLITSGGETATGSAGTDVLHRIAAPNVRDFFIGAGTQLEKVSATVDGTKVNVFTSHADAKAAQTMLSSAVASVRYLNGRVGAYDYPELNVMGVPGFIDEGMEYPNAVVVDTTDKTPDLNSTTVHEVAHQWFYGMAGNNQYDDPWLDESLTTYEENHFLHDVQGQALPKPAGSLEDEFRKAGDHDVSSPVSVLAANAHDEKSVRPYVATVYRVGPMVLDELRGEIGPRAFDAGMRSYFTANKHGIGTTQGFISAMSQSAGADLAPWFAAHRILANEPDANVHLDPNGPAAPGASYGE